MCILDKYSLNYQFVSLRINKKNYMWTLSVRVVRVVHDGTDASI